jgi:flagellar assembly protein FliH
MKPLSSDAPLPGLNAPEAMQARPVTTGPEADAARAVSFDRPLVELPGWGDPRLARQVAKATRAGREQGRAEGYAIGWAEGRRAAAERERQEAAQRTAREEATRRHLTGQAQTVLAALATAARTLAEQVTPAWDELVENLLDGALALAAAALDRELAGVDAEVREALRTALRLLPSADVVTVHANPGDLAVLRGPAGTGLPDGVQLVADPTVAAGTVLARTPLHSLPVDLRAALRTAQEVLR